MTRFATLLLPALLLAAGCACRASDLRVVPIPELKRWEANMVRYGRQHADERSGGMVERFVWYYDGQRVFYQIADYTKDPSWSTCAQNSEETYRGYVENTARVPGWRIFPHGLAMDFKRTGDEKAKIAALKLAKKSAFAHGRSLEGMGRLRENSYIMNAYIVAEQLGEPRNPKLKKVLENALHHLDRYPFEHNNWAPFMMALTCEALIGYHTHVEADPRIPEAIQMALDVCWEKAWVEKNQSFWYRSKNQSSGAPDLNMLIAPAYAWIYLRTGEAKYRDRGDKLFAGGVRGAYLAGGKQFSQNYRWSFKYVEWCKEANRRIAAGEGLGPNRRVPQGKPPGSTKAVQPKLRLVAVDPFSGVRKELAAVRTLAAKGDFDGALISYKTIRGEGATTELLSSFAEGIQAGRALRALIIAQAAAKRPGIYIDFAGRTMRAKLVSADDDGARLAILGNRMLVPWRELSPQRFYGIAAKLSDDTPADHLRLARYCAAMGLENAALEEMRMASVETILCDEVRRLQFLLK